MGTNILVLLLMSATVSALPLVPRTTAAETCMEQCVEDTDCSCSGVSACRGADAVTKLCVDAGDNPPADPPHRPIAVDWPEVWAADMSTITYNDFSSKIKTQGGRFYYDNIHRRQKQDFGKTSLLYVGGNSSSKTPSRFYFEALGGLACFYVDTTDPITHADIGPPAPDFMATCAAAQMAHYVGREKVAGEWTDHHNCSVEYDNQTIAFQSWHSLGLGTSKFGLPLALSSGDSKPNWQAPRLTTTTYGNHSLEPQDPSLFTPSRVCIPIPQHTAREQLGLAKAEPLFAAFSREAVRARAALMLSELAENSSEEQHVTAAVEGTWHGCESFPGFGSAADNVQLQFSQGTGGDFNISTADYLSSRTCGGAPDLTWGHSGHFTCNSTAVATFTRTSLWIEPRTIGGVLFGKVLCPHVSLSRGVRTMIPVNDLPKLCGSVTFDNCESYIDALGGNGTVLHRSKAPSCKVATAVVSDDGPPLACTSGGCQSPCMPTSVAERK